LKAEKGSQKWIQKLINDNANIINAVVRLSLGLPKDEKIDWYSPIEKDDYAEYYDDAFLEKLGLSNLATNLQKFWQFAYAS
jgi:hypothetical protein